MLEEDIEPTLQREPLQTQHIVHVVGNEIHFVDQHSFDPLFSHFIPQFLHRLLPGLLGFGQAVLIFLPDLFEFGLHALDLLFFLVFYPFMLLLQLFKFLEFGVPLVEESGEIVLFAAGVFFLLPLLFVALLGFCIFFLDFSQSFQLRFLLSQLHQNSLGLSFLLLELCLQGDKFLFFTFVVLFSPNYFLYQIFFFQILLIGLGMETSIFSKVGNLFEAFKLYVLFEQLLVFFVEFELLDGLVLGVYLVLQIGYLLVEFEDQPTGLSPSFLCELV